MHLPLCRRSARLSVRVNKELAINLTLSMNHILYFTVFPFSCFSIGTMEVTYFSVSFIFFQTFKLPFELFHQLFDYKMTVIFDHLRKTSSNFFWCHILNYRYCVQPPYICIMAMIPDSFMKLLNQILHHRCHHDHSNHHQYQGLLRNWKKVSDGQSTSFGWIIHWWLMTRSWDFHIEK